MSRGQTGFTLIELMIVVAVVAILAAIAIPSYTESVRKGRRGDAKAVLIEAAQLAERFRTVNDNSYLGASLVIPTQSPKTGTAYYNIAFASRTANAFKLTATPVGPQASDRCGTLSIDQTGAKKHSTGSNAECSFGDVGT